ISELGGQNTSSEMASLKEHPEFWQGKRCAILTSASHLPRAMRLAESAGIRAMPIAADYRSSSGPLTLNHLLPEAHRLEKLQIILKEWIAMKIGR
ncbi:MAG TPA: ElyC/SanA/YdcF family protein, partial [Pirellula sp.]|nr:ElyC/SanA/YdcF family protein [Pirellula sp.]